MPGCGFGECKIGPYATLPPFMVAGVCAVGTPANSADAEGVPGVWRLEPVRTPLRASVVRPPLSTGCLPSVRFGLCVFDTLFELAGVRVLTVWFCAIQELTPMQSDQKTIHATAPTEMHDLIARTTYKRYMNQAIQTRILVMSVVYALVDGSKKLPHQWVQQGCTYSGLLASIIVLFTRVSKSSNAPRVCNIRTAQWLFLQMACA